MEEVLQLGERAGGDMVVCGVLGREGCLQQRSRELQLGRVGELGVSEIQRAYTHD
jgi:hypothetical protein